MRIPARSAGILTGRSRFDLALVQRGFVEFLPHFFESFFKNCAITKHIDDDLIWRFARSESGNPYLFGKSARGLLFGRLRFFLRDGDG